MSEDPAPLTNAERQARHRAKQATKAGKPIVRFQAKPDRRTRPQRWADAVAELTGLQADYGTWLDTMPDNLHDTPTGQALQAIAELDLADLAAITPPRGFGRD
jgi:glycogen debranching enzyme